MILKTINLLALVILVLSFTFVTSTPSIAGGKASAKKTKQEKKAQKKAEKKLQKDKAKHYKTVQKPALKKQLAQNKQERKQAKADVKNNKKLLKKAKAEEKKFEKAANASKKLLDVQKDKLDKAERKLLLESTDKTRAKNQADFNKLKQRYDKAENDYESGPKKRWQDKVAARQTAENNLANSEKNYEDNKVAGVKLAIEKVNAKNAIKDKTVPAVSVGQYQLIPKLSKVPASTKIEYGQLLPNQPVNQYSSAGIQFKN